MVTAMAQKVSNIIEFPMDRVRTDSVRVQLNQQEYDLEAMSLDLLEQARAIEAQSERLLEMFD
jgi:hypothetical protein